MQLWILLHGNDCPSFMNDHDKIGLYCSVLRAFPASHTLKQKCCHLDRIFVNGCRTSCQKNNLQCSQWWKFRQKTTSDSVWLIENTKSHGCIYLSLIMRPYYRWYVRMATLCSDNINWIDHIQGMKSVHLSMTVVTAIWQLSAYRLCRYDKSSMTTFELQ